MGKPTATPNTCWQFFLDPHDGELPPLDELLAELEEDGVRTVRAGNVIVGHGEAAVLPLSEIATSVDIGKELRRTALEALGRIRPDGRALLHRWADGSGSMAARALAELFLTAAVDDPDLDLLVGLAERALDVAGAQETKWILNGAFELAAKFTAHGLPYDRLLEPLQGPVLELCQSDDPWVATVALKVMTVVEPPAAHALPVLVGLLADSQERGIHFDHAVVTAVSHYGAEANPALEALRKRLTPEVDLRVVLALQAMGAAAAAAHPDALTVLANLDERQSGDSKNVQKALEKLIRLIEDPPVSKAEPASRLEYLQRLFERLDNNDPIRFSSSQSTSSRALGEARALDDPALIEPLKKLLGRKTKRTQKRAIQVLGYVALNTGDTAARQLLIAQFERPDLSHAMLEDLVAACAWASLPEAQPFVRQTTADGLLFDQHPLSNYMHRFRDTETLGHIAARLFEKRHDHLQFALNILYDAADPVAVEPAIDLLEAEDMGYRKQAHTENRACAIAVLAACGDHRAVVPLRRELAKGKSSEVLCVKALYRLGIDTASDEMIAFLQRRLKQFRKKSRAVSERSLPDIRYALESLCHANYPEDEIRDAARAFAEEPVRSALFYSEVQLIDELVGS